MTCITMASRRDHSSSERATANGSIAELGQSAPLLSEPDLNDAEQAGPELFRASGGKASHAPQLRIERTDESRAAAAAGGAAAASRLDPRRLAVAIPAAGKRTHCRMKARSNALLPPFSKHLPCFHSIIY